MTYFGRKKRRENSLKNLDKGRYDQFDHSELPILFLDHQKDFQKITEDFLNKQYNVLSKKIKPYYKTLDWISYVKRKSLIKTKKSLKTPLELKR